MCKYFGKKVMLCFKIETTAAKINVFGDRGIKNAPHSWGALWNGGAAFLVLV